jgi:hypothetical protein
MEEESPGVWYSDGVPGIVGTKDEVESALDVAYADLLRRTR